MPTGGSARFASPLNVLDFVHIVSLVALDPATTRQIAPAAATIALAKGWTRTPMLPWSVYCPITRTSIGYSFHGVTRP